MIVAVGSGAASVRLDVEPSLEDAVRGLFPEAASSGGSAPALAVARARTGFELVGAAPGAERIETLPDLLTAVERAVCEALLEAEVSAVHLHAAGAVVDGAAVLALGGSGAGKSSVALAWSLAGYPLLGDDVVLLDPDGRVRTFPRLLKVHRSVLAGHGIDPSETLGHDPGLDEVWFDPRSAGGWADEPVRPGVIALLDRREDDAEEGDAVRSTERTAPDALRHVLSSVMPTGAPPEAALDALVDRLPSCRLVEVGFRSSRAAAALLADGAWAAVGSAGTRTGTP